MAFTLPGPAGEGWWFEEDVGTWRLMFGPNRRKGAVPPPVTRDAGARQGAPDRDEASGKHEETDGSPCTGEQGGRERPQGPRPGRPRFPVCVP